MKVLVVGSGGREQAIAWACRRYGHDVTIAPELTSADEPDLVIPGPEAALVAGLADECARRGIPCFGPTAELARLESSKGFARQLATDLGIPGPAFARFASDEHDDAVEWYESLGRPIVVKLDGLAAGKGVTVPETHDETIAAIRAADTAFVLEERMSGPECTLIALCDGTTAVALPLAQDHKRIGEGDTGPNTGGMGAYAPAPVPYSAADLAATFVQPILDHFSAAGTPYVGVLYAGLMLTPDGPRLVEYNVRFGDPEAQALLPLLDCDLAAVALSATHGRLDRDDVGVRPGAACTVVAAAAGYPSEPRTGDAVTLPTDAQLDGALLFPAGLRDGRTSGGRVLAVTGIGDDLPAARAHAYAAIAQRQLRRDAVPARHRLARARRRPPLVRRRRRRHRRGQPRRRPDACRRRAHPRRRGDPRRRQLRRRLLGEGDRGDGRPRAGGVHRRRRHQGRTRRVARPRRRSRSRHRQPLHR